MELKTARISRDSLGAEDARDDNVPEYRNCKYSEPIAASIYDHTGSYRRDLYIANIRSSRE